MSWFSTHRIDDRYLYVAFFVVCVLSRLPFLGTFSVVAYDGTYYLGQARTLFDAHMAGAFPIGYPVAVKILQLILRDYQTAGMAASFVAAVGATIVAYLIVREFAGRGMAVLAALAVALNPLAIRLSLATLSESLYTFLVLLGLLMFVRRRWLWFGVALGLAAITRPEAIAVAGILGLTRWRHPRQLVVIGAAFLSIYAVNTARLSVNAGRVVILPKSEFIGSSTSYWKLREASIDYEGRVDTEEKLAEEGQAGSAVSDYVRRIGVESKTVVRHVFPVTMLLALFALRRRRYLFMAAALVSFFVIPLATVRSIDRYIFPYVPVLIILAVAGAADIRRRTARLTAVALLAASMVVLPAVNRATLLEPDEPNLDGIKRAGQALRDRVDPGDRIADRKPYFAFYAGGEYVEIPVAPYEDAMEFLLLEEHVRYLVLSKEYTHVIRPAFRPLMYSKAVANGEVRLRQVYFDPGGVTVYQRVLDEDPLQWTRLTATGGTDVCPAWSPDGHRIAFRSLAEEGSGIYVIAAGERGAVKVADVHQDSDQLAWSPDGRRLAYADGEPGTGDIYVADLASGRVETLVAQPGDDRSPSWSPSGGEIVYSSDRTGSPELWEFDLEDRRDRRITTDGDNTRPTVSPSGTGIAWIKRDQGVVVMHRSTGRRIQFLAPRKVRYAPSWSPDERYLAVTAQDWGSWDLYLLKSNGTNAILLTRNRYRDAMPGWSPDGQRIVLASDVGEESLSIFMIEALRPYLDRLEARDTPQVFDNALWGK